MKFEAELSSRRWLVKMEEIVRSNDRHNMAFSSKISLLTSSAASSVSLIIGRNNILNSKISLDITERENGIQQRNLCFTSSVASSVSLTI